MSKQTSTIIGIVIIVTVLVGIFSVVWYAMQSLQGDDVQELKSQALDWKTYTNTSTKYGFEITYPASWSGPMETSNGEVNFGGKIFIHYYKTAKDLPVSFYSKDKENIILPKYGYSATKVHEDYCMVLITNQIFTQTNFESFDPSQEPVYAIEGPILPCEAKFNEGTFSKEYVLGLENTYNQMVDSLKFFIK